MRTKHGRSMYRHAGCRCDACVAANRTYSRDWARARVLAGPLPGATHGTVATYQTGCRCADCRAANAARTRAQTAI